MKHEESHLVEKTKISYVFYRNDTTTTKYLSQITNQRMKILNQASNNKENIEIAITMSTKVEFTADNGK